jgi:HEPN domain-containing protein
LATDDDPAALRGAATYAQQAAEKALKAAIALTGGEPPRTHDLAALANACSATLPAIDLAPLTAALSSGRYPDLDAAPYAVHEARHLVSDARIIVGAIAAWLEDAGLDLSTVEPV